MSHRNEDGGAGWNKAAGGDDLEGHSSIQARDREPALGQ